MCCELSLVGVLMERPRSKTLSTFFLFFFSSYGLSSHTAGSGIAADERWLFRVGVCRFGEVW